MCISDALTEMSGHCHACKTATHREIEFTWKPVANPLQCSQDLLNSHMDNMVDVCRSTISTRGGQKSDSIGGETTYQLYKLMGFDQCNQSSLHYSCMYHLLIL